mgnify:CR=1 FL=1
MAPEIHNEERYSPSKSDVFSAGVILFVMLTRHFPISNKADKTDPFYKLIYGNRHDLFWKFHSRNKAGLTEFYGQDLMNLISSMLMPDSTHRPRYPEILNHPWMKGPIATEEEAR